MKSLPLKGLGWIFLVGACAGAPSTQGEGIREPVVEAASPAVTPDAAAAPVGPSLVFEVEPADALVVLDGEPVGTGADLARNGAVKVAPGIHTIVITRSGLQTWRSELLVKDGPEIIRVRLRPNED